MISRTPGSDDFVIISDQEACNVLCQRGAPFVVERMLYEKPQVERDEKPT